MTPLVGYLHIGSAAHGVTRYGRMLAEAARASGELSVIETELSVTGDPVSDRRAVAAAAARLGDADVVHVQYNNRLEECIWGSRWAQLRNVTAFTRGSAAPLVVTLHDLYPPMSLRAMLRRGRARLAAAGGATPAAETQPPIGAGIVRRNGARVQRLLQPDVLTLRWLRWRARLCVVSSREERRRLDAFFGRSGADVIPHLVERRTLAGSAEAAKIALGLGGRRVVTLLGYIHPRKGHRLLIDAMAHLPEDVTVVFAGRAEPRHAAFLETLSSAAQRGGVADRLRVTGWLDEPDLERYLVATDVGVCPFETASASGSLSTWISTAAAVVASDLPLVAEYNAMEPGAIATFRPYAPEAAAAAIRASLAAPGARAATARLGERLSPEAVMQRHAAVYRSVARERAGSRRRECGADAARRTHDADAVAGGAA